MVSDRLRFLQKITMCLALCVFVASLVRILAGAAQVSAPEAPAYTSSGQLIRPVDYREWVYLTSGLGMTYGPSQPAADRPPLFDNVFVTRAAYREFLRTGVWPDKTMLILEIRRSEASVSINNGGRTQGEVAAIEAAVKDQGRFSDSNGWAYFTFDSPQGLVSAADPLPSTATCYSCHQANTAVDNTFVQFYPTLFEVARRLGTIKPTYDPARKP
jgi:hypothetical protein